MIGSAAEKIKGMIKYPCCPQKKALVVMGTHGCATHQCPNCGKYIEFNYDTMTARQVSACRGVSQRFNNSSK